MKTYASRLEHVMKIRKIRAIDLAKVVGVDRSLISMYLSGKREPKYETNDRIAKALSVSPDYLLGLTELMEQKNLSELEESLVRKIPVFAPISCGNGSYEDGQIIDYIGIPESRLRFGKKYYGQYAKGDSMIGAGINDGDLLIFEECSWINEGKIGCFCINEELAVCKRYTVGADNCIYLMSANDKYAPIRIDQTCDCFRVVGRLISIIKNIE